MMSKLSTVILKATRLSASRHGFDLTPNFRQTVKPSTWDIIERVKPFTMTSEQRLTALCDAIDYISLREIPGDIVECGVWKGGSSMAAALSLLGNSDRTRNLYLYDTYDGMSEPTEYDKEIGSGVLAGSLMAQSTKDDLVWAFSPLEEVKANIEATSYPSDKVHFVKGKVEETIPRTIPEKIAVLRLDTDWYESTKHELEHLFPRLERGGVLIIDDYGHWDGARRAVDEYFSDRNHAVLLSRIDYTGRMAIKI